MTTDYELYRGKCKQLAEKLCQKEVSYTLIRGWYDCPIWGKQEHWWCVDLQGGIHDPSKKQFPSKGCGQYTPYIGNTYCEYCGKETPEERTYFVEQHTYCSHTCYGHDVGF